MKRMIDYPHAVRDWLFANDQAIGEAQESSSRPLLFFIFCLIAYCLYMVAMQPEWVLGGEMWAESATNYFPNAASSSFYTRFFSTDAGYIPLPQRLLAFLGYALNLPARAIPYFYTWSALLLTAAMVGAFCLKPFRTLVRSDSLRLFTAMAVLMVADFQTRTFINFTYFSTFFIAVITALALVENSSDVPRWAWWIPILMISKPAVLSALPGVILVAAVSKRRFKFIAIASTLTGLLQVIQMGISYPKTIFIWNKYTTIQKILASLEYFIGSLGAFSLRKSIHFDSIQPLWPLSLGLGILALCVWIIIKKRNNASALILTGSLLLYFNLLINCFAMSVRWNVDNIELIITEPLERYNIAVYFGTLLIIVGLIIASLDIPSRCKAKQKQAGITIFLCWFLFLGWFEESRALNKAPDFPALNNSQWQTMANAIDSGEPVCVPVDPVDMMYERNCRQLNTQIGGLWWPKVFTFKNAQLTNENTELTLTPPQSTLNSDLISLAIMVKMPTVAPSMINVGAVLKLRNGTTRYLSGSRQLPVSGGLVMLTGKKATATDEIQEVSFKFSAPVEIGYASAWQQTEQVPVVFWMGTPH